MNAMNKYHTNVYERITDIMYLLYEADGISVNSLASKYELSPDIILEDLKYLSASEELDVLIFPCDEELDTDEFLCELINGEHNDIELYAEKIDDNYMVSLQMSLFEKTFFNAFMKEHDLKEKLCGTNEILIKNTFDEISWNVLDVIKQINEAIREHRVLEIQYKMDDAVRKIIMMPIKIVKMVSSGISYCMAQCGNAFEYIRLDQVEKIEVRFQDKYALSEDKVEQEMELFEFRWGMHEKDDPFKFAMIVYNEANLPGRLYKELKNRKYGQWIKNTDQSYLYTDIVIDYYSLKQWVMALGSSVKVIEPKRLRAEILEDAYYKLDMYCMVL